MKEKREKKKEHEMKWKIFELIFDLIWLDFNIRINCVYVFHTKSLSIFMCMQLLCECDNTLPSKCLRPDTNN